MPSDSQNQIAHCIDKYATSAPALSHVRLDRRKACHRAAGMYRPNGIKAAAANRKRKEPCSIPRRKYRRIAQKWNAWNQRELRGPAPRQKASLHSDSQRSSKIGKGRTRGRRLTTSEYRVLVMNLAEGIANRPRGFSLHTVLFRLLLAL